MSWPLSRITCIRCLASAILQPACPLALPQGLSRADQAEVDINRVAVYLNLAAVHMAQKVGRSKGRITAAAGAW